MRVRHALSLLAAAAGLGAAVRPVAAQSTPPSTTPAAAPAPQRWDAHPTGKYTLEIALPDRVMPVDLTLSDSAGTTVASFWPVGDRDAHAMAVTVKDTDLLLHADTPRGPLDIVLQRQADRLTGRWTLGAEHGTLQGKVSG